MRFTEILVIFTFVICAFVFVANGQQRHRRRRCDIQMMLSHDETNATSTIPRRCKKGSVAWHYPRASLTLNFYPRSPRNRPFWVCIRDQSAATGMRVYDMSDDTERDMPTISDHYTTCVPTGDGRVSLRWEAREEAHYMAAIAYWVVKPPR